MKANRILLSLLLLCAACGQTEASTVQNNSSYNGPVVSEDTRTTEEKELAMLQDAVETYNEDQVSDTEEQLQVEIPDLPIEVSSIPEITSLNQLTEIAADETTTNAVYVGRQQIDDNYAVLYTIYHATGDSFWLNGKVEFEQSLDAVVENDPQFADIKTSLDSLLAKQETILSWFYALNITLAEEASSDPQYYPVLSMEGLSDLSIDAMKSAAEEIFTSDYLQQAFYPSAFEGEYPVYKVVDGVLCARPSDVSVLPDHETYATEAIAAVRDNGDTIDIDLHVSVYGNMQETLRRITLISTSEGLRLSAAY